MVHAGEYLVVVGNSAAAQVEFIEDVFNFWYFVGVVDIHCSHEVHCSVFISVFSGVEFEIKASLDRVLSAFPSPVDTFTRLIPVWAGF